MHSMYDPWGPDRLQLAIMMDRQSSPYRQHFSDVRCSKPKTQWAPVCTTCFAPPPSNSNYAYGPLRHSYYARRKRGAAKYSYRQAESISLVPDHYHRGIWRRKCYLPNAFSRHKQRRTPATLEKSVIPQSQLDRGEKHSACHDMVCHDSDIDVEYDLIDETTHSSRALLRPISPLKRACSYSSVHFCPQIKVIEIPSHRAFTKEEKARIWSDRDSIRRNAFRNTKEWIYEGCNLDFVVEEDRFLHKSDGSSVHPAHWKGSDESVEASIRRSRSRTVPCAAQNSCQ